MTIDLQLNNSSHITDFILSKINNGDWRYGDKIWTENEFINNLKVKRPAVRQAIEKLCMLSILRKVQGSGTYVEKVQNLSLNSLLVLDNSNNDLLDVLYFRLYFEMGNIELFLKNSTVDDFAELKKYCDLMNENRENKTEYYKYDFLFHKALAKGTHNKIIIMISDIIFDILAKNQITVQNVYIDLGISNKKAFDVHDFLYNSLLEKDIRMSKALMYRHVDSAIKAVEQSQIKERLRREII